MRYFFAKSLIVNQNPLFPPFSLFQQIRLLDFPALVEKQHHSAKSKMWKGIDFEGMFVYCRAPVAIIRRRHSPAAIFSYSWHIRREIRCSWHGSGLASCLVVLWLWRPLEAARHSLTCLTASSSELLQSSWATPQTLLLLLKKYSSIFCDRHSLIFLTSPGLCQERWLEIVNCEDARIPR